MAVNDGDRVSTAKLLETLKGLQASRHLGSEPEVDPQTNEKTKHTIKQDYVPNADWNQNDPDGEGYVEGRTHWVEDGVTDIVPEYDGDSSSIMGDAYFAPSFNKIYGYSWDAGPAGEAGEWYPEFEAVKTNYQGLDAWLLAMDNSGNQITDVQTAISSSANMIMNIDTESMVGRTGYIMATRTPKTVRMMGEVIHKLDRKFYDYTEPYDDTICVKKNELQIKHSHIEMPFADLSPKTVGYDYLDLPNCKIVGNIKSFINSWDTQTNTGVMNATNNPIANTTVGTTGICCLSNGFLQFVNEGTNGIVLKNPYPSTLNLSRGADLNIAQTFIIENTD